MRSVTPKLRAGNAPRALVILASLALFSIGDAARAEPSDADCRACHDQPVLKRQDGKPLAPNHEKLAASVHGSGAKEKISCVGCHADLASGPAPTKDRPHAAKLEPAACAACHKDVAKRHPFHPKMAEDPVFVACQDCHGGHEVGRAKDAAFKFARKGQPDACGACHESQRDDFKPSVHGKGVAADEKETPTCVTCHKSAVVTLADGAPANAKKMNEVKMCLACHLDSPEVRARESPSAGFIGAYEKSVHGKALAAGKEKAPACVDCHGSHEIKKASEADSKVNKLNVAKTCGECHQEIAKAFQESTHGVALAKGTLDAPTCTDCHGEHEIASRKDPTSRTAPGNVSAKVCEPCHASLALTEKYEIPADRFKSFEDSFHGLAGKGGAAKVANCASCHGAHDIKPSSDPTSRVSKARLAETCGKCHPGATQRFTQGSMHATTTKKDPILYWIARIYVWLIIVVIGGMFLHNAIDFRKKSRHVLAVRRGEHHEEPAQNKSYLRMTVAERFMHGGLALSFIALVITGFALRYPDSWWVSWVRHHSARAFEWRSLLHRISAVVMTVTAIWHVFYVALTRRGRQFLWDMLPGPRDVREAVENVGHNLGLVAERPRLGRFCYVEKAEYWALIWGTVVMTVTGLMMWFDNTTMNHVSKLGYDIARLFHYYEAWLATLAIIVWHWYAVIFSPSAYPMNMAWLTGVLSRREMEEEHPRELEALDRAEAERAEAERAEAERAAKDAASRA